MPTILQHLYKKNSLHEIEVETLQQFSEQYPYFAIGHYLLAKKIAPASANDFKVQFRKALVYFHNPSWLQYQLSVEDKPIESNPTSEDTLPAADGLAGKITTPHQDLRDKAALVRETGQPSPGETDHQATSNEELAPTESASLANPQTVKAEAQTPQQPERFSFQAYHTVDYFASQGIRLSQEMQSNDKLGKQLKSFTEWLKTMRRLPEAVAEEVLDKINDVEIVQFAADSLEEKEVVTEAMAEVLIRQEKFAKATDVYNKLSLLHPHKSAYFAAKIEDLKQH